MCFTSNLISSILNCLAFAGAEVPKWPPKAPFLLCPFSRPAMVPTFVQTVRHHIHRHGSGIQLKQVKRDISREGSCDHNIFRVLLALLDRWPVGPPIEKWPWPWWSWQQRHRTLLWSIENPASRQPPDVYPKGKTAVEERAANCRSDGTWRSGIACSGREYSLLTIREECLVDVGCFHSIWRACLKGYWLCWSLRENNTSRLSGAALQAWGNLQIKGPCCLVDHAGKNSAENRQSTFCSCSAWLESLDNSPSSLAEPPEKEDRDCSELLEEAIHLLTSLLFCIWTFCLQVLGPSS